MKSYVKFFILSFLSLNINSQVVTSIANNGNLILEDIPEIPQKLKDDLKRFQSVRSAPFRGFDISGQKLYISCLLYTSPSPRDPM